MTQTPISPKTIKKLQNKWATLIRCKEFTSFIYPPRADPTRRVVEFLHDTQLQQKLKLDTEKTIHAILDFKGEPHVQKGELYADILSELSRELREKGREVVETDAITLLKRLEIEGYRIVLWVFGLDRMLTRVDVSILKDIALIYKLFSNISVLNFIRIYLGGEIGQALREEMVLTTNIVYIPIYSREDSDYFISFMEEQWGMKVTPAQRRFILENFSGKLGVIKGAMRMVRDNPKIDLDSLLDSDQIKTRGIVTLQALDKQVLPVVYEIAGGDYKDSGEDNPIIDYLIKIGWVKKIDGKYQLFPPFMRSIKLSEETPGEQKPFQQLFAEIFTFREQRVFGIFLKNLNSIVSRDMIANGMWGANAEDEYSDWAIDQLMYRLRLRISQAKLPYTIKTKRGQGFMMLDNR